MIIELVDQLLDRGLQLISYKKKLKKELFENFIDPLFTEFENVHSAYLESFAKYRDFIEKSDSLDWIDELRRIVEKDNLFSAASRIKLVQLSKEKDNDILSPYIIGICEYLMGASLVEPLGRENDLSGNNPIYVQRWRCGFNSMLVYIAEENWQTVIDPGCGRPPLSDTEIKKELILLQKKNPLKRADLSKQDSLKRSCALESLDAVICDMQEQYQHVCQLFVELKITLL